MKTRTAKRLILFVVAFGALGCAYLLIPWSWQTLDLGKPDQYTSAEIESIDWHKPKDTRSTIVTCRDAAAISSLVDIMASAHRIIDCKCLWTGFVRLTDKDGHVRELQLVPGHGDDTYDLRYDGKRYTLDRSKLQAAIESAGAELPTAQ